MLDRLLAGLSRHIPSQCAVCHAWPARAVCDACVQRFGQPVTRCTTCACPLPASMRQCRTCQAHTPPLDAALAAVAYDFPWSDLIVQFKFQQQPGWAHTLAALMRNAPWVEPALEAAHWLLPMPLSAARLRERGFNQAQLLAQHLCAPKLRTDVLLRIKDAAPQSSLSREERLRNVKGAYALEPGLARQMHGADIVLVDDVMTTGASLHAAALALRHAGAARITAVVLARAE